MWFLKKIKINCTILGKNLALSSAEYWAESHGLSHGLWLWKTEARARGQAKPSSWLGFGLAYTAWLGLAPGFQAKPAHHYAYQKGLTEKVAAWAVRQQKQHRQASEGAMASIGAVLDKIAQKFGVPKNPWE